ncbi:interferon gamma receptor 2 isoform X1 [Mesocricetus auratus]|uniref:Interferon gamma receptor 2 isoform X1 n=1 Tax=Mesocricetus auratus TaxID=10036 RepID=A0ABM2XUR7_MESAU|nr:interferon gamma receptor 2 isoform X1 [Mesocricetus auratus]
MRPPPLWLLPLLLGGLGAAAPRLDSFSQLAAPQHLKLHLYNNEQILSWEPSPPSNDTRPVVYQVEFKYVGGSWHKFTEVNCTDITVTRCDFTGGGRSKGFSGIYFVSLRVRAKQGERTSNWVTLTWFQRYCNVTVGPPKNILVIPGKGSLTTHFSPPFNVTKEAAFEYRVHYWEKTGAPQVRGPFKESSIVLSNLKPFRVYCLQIEAQLIGRGKIMCQPGRSLSNVSCHETAADDTTGLQVILIPVGTFSLLLVLTGACFFLFLRYQGRVKYWFQAPPTIPGQIKEYLKDPDQPFLEALDKDHSPKDDAWDSVSIVSSPEKEQDVLRTL